MVSPYKKRAKKGYNNDKEQSNKDERSFVKKELKDLTSEELRDSRDSEFLDMIDQLNKPQKQGTLKRNKKHTKRMVEEKLAHALKKLEQFEKRHKTCHESTKWLYQSILYHHKKDIEKLQKELDKFEKV